MNRLARATSPYLRQHADNPVDWFPWGPEALERARREDKPLFVSIGYASCHWCHVMAHESFEDPAVAADLAASFVAVKVDREERPDLDTVYMTAVQAMTGSGGWPMSVFCTPDGRPFFGGTYYPPEDRHGMPGFRRVLGALAEAWAERRDEVERQADALAEAVRNEARLLDRLAAEAGADPGPVDFGAVLARLVEDLEARFDGQWGGFGPAPKFPRPTYVELCLRQERRTGSEGAARMARLTLDAMAAGGIYDHLAGGFARYSTDARWLVPHFEKMLTDQALLARAYLHAWQAGGKADDAQVLAETVDWVLDELGTPGGGLCSSYDADAAGVEGGHATFTADEARRALAEGGRADLAEAALEWFGISEEGNWEGTNVLHRPVGAPLGRNEDIEEACRLLLAARRRRPQPSRDDKVLTEWNAMFLAVLAEAAGATGRPDWRAAAEALGQVCFFGLRRPDGRWVRSLGSDQPAFAADYAWLVEAATRLYELTGEASWLARAEETADALWDLFADPERGGLFATGHDAEALVVRPKEVLDGAVPAAGSVAAQALLRLGALTAEERFAERGRQLVTLAAPLLAAHATAVPDMLAAAAWLGGGQQIVVAGDRPDLLAEVRRRWLPDAVVAWGEPVANALWEAKVPGAAYVCRQFVCRQPAGDPGTLAEQLDDPSSGSSAATAGEVGG